jgi:excisionase family DNA binding protein
MDRMLTAEEIAERLGMKTQWVWAQTRAGRIPHVRLGRYRRFRESAVEAWLRNHEADSTTPATTTPPSPVPLRRRAQDVAERHERHSASTSRPGTASLASTAELVGETRNPTWAPDAERPLLPASQKIGP